MMHATTPEGTIARDRGFGRVVDLVERARAVGPEVLEARKIVIGGLFDDERDALHLNERSVRKSVAVSAIATRAAQVAIVTAAVADSSSRTLVPPVEHPVTPHPRVASGSPSASTVPTISDTRDSISSTMSGLDHQHSKPKDPEKS
jgi:hypothetical protein